MDMIDARTRSLAAALLLVLPTVGAAQSDAAALVEQMRQAIGQVPRTLRVIAAGSGYLPARDGGGGSGGRFRIERYTQELDLGVPAERERVVRVDSTAGKPEEREIGTLDATPDAPWADRYRLWSSPFGFLLGAQSHATHVTRSTVLGTEYRVISFTADDGNEVEGYVNDQNLLERTRTEIDDPALGKVQFEAIYLQWADFDGVKFPSLVIEKKNEALTRVLVVDRIEPGVDLQPSPQAGEDGH
jgi:hypothetical protein